MTPEKSFTFPPDEYSGDSELFSEIKITKIDEDNVNDVDVVLPGDTYEVCLNPVRLVISGNDPIKIGFKWDR